MEEIWKDIEGYEGLYQVSNLGRVKSLERIIIRSNNLKYTCKEKILKPAKDRGGYLFVRICKNGESEICKVHRLVVNSFIENPNNYPQVNHIDENKLNNNIENLEWCTHEYNINYGTHNERMAKAHEKPIYCIENNKIYNSIKQASFELDISNQRICDVLKGRQKQTKGYSFRYANKILFTGGK